MFYDSVSLSQVKLKYRLSSYVIIMIIKIIYIYIVIIEKIYNKNNVQTGNTKMVVFCLSLSICMHYLR